MADCRFGAPIAGRFTVVDVAVNDLPGVAVSQGGWAPIRTQPRDGVNRSPSTVTPSVSRCLPISSPAVMSPLTRILMVPPVGGSATTQGAAVADAAADPAPSPEPAPPER